MYSIPEVVLCNNTQSNIHELWYSWSKLDFIWQVSFGQYLSTVTYAGELSQHFVDWREEHLLYYVFSAHSPTCNIMKIDPIILPRNTGLPQESPISLDSWYQF
jgi:hypothetical protein